ncbi:hypothetical protein OIDMADRAFT_19132 [Oidiodendron maius Zn]|uniref:Uncharacterized protein n=1 Tax=Oidiodendron maius (strain Zn) TaxID=913774 RepID=A0A0C3GYV3_OIDMZ|nr:hypothetical protein OIDMADRAFT_19132 [Oidiodendron maius Zn]
MKLDDNRQECATVLNFSLYVAFYSEPQFLIMATVEKTSRALQLSPVTMEFGCQVSVQVSLALRTILMAFALD